MDVTNITTKTTAPQNDLSRAISTMPSIQNWQLLYVLMHHGGISVHLPTRFFYSGIRSGDCQVQLELGIACGPTHRFFSRRFSQSVLSG